MAQVNKSLKHTIIDKSNSQIVITTAVAGFIVVFSLVSSWFLLGQLTYQNRVIDAKKKALTQLKADVDATNSLVSSYKTFVSGSSNVLGGSPTGTGSQDGTNAKIVLDALPSQYDFPALATSLEKILSGQKVTIDSITGTDDEIAQSATGGSDAPAPVPMPFQISVGGNYQSIQSVISVLEHSIRPVQLQTMSITGDQSNLTLNISAQTFYQPEKDLNVTTKVVK